MRVKMPGSFSSVRNMPGGAPQGTKCGNCLFCVSICDLTRERPDLENIQYKQAVPEMSELNNSLGLRNLAQRLDISSDVTSCPSSPIAGGGTDHRDVRHPFCLYDTDEEEDSSHILRRFHHVDPPRWTDRDNSTALFVDDLTCLEKCDTTCAAVSYTHLTLPTTPYV